MNTSHRIGDSDPDRGAEVIVNGPVGGPGRRGSSYRSRPGTALTAAHVVTDALPLRVYFRADHPGAWTADGVVICKGSQIEVAIMPIAGESHSTDQLCGDQPSVYRYYVHMLGYGDALAEPA